MNAGVDDTREFVAETREEAIAKAENFFRVSADQLDVWVIPPTVTVSGLGGRVLMLAAPRSARSAPREERRPERSERREPRREERRDEPRETRREERAEAPRQREREERPPREERPAREERPPREERAPREERPPRERVRAERPAPARAAEPEPSDDEGEEFEEGELGPVGEFVAGLLERMKLADVAITEDETEDGDIIITLAGRSITALSDREPRLAAALSHLAHRAAEALIEDDATARVEIKGARRAPQRDERPERGARGDRGGNGRRGGRDGRGGGGGGGGPRRGESDRQDIDEVALERMAREAARIVRDSGEPELLRPMSSRERWVVHNTLKDERGVRSESEGDGPRKRVRIVPA